MSITDDRTAALPWEARPALDSAYEWDIVNADGWRVAEVIHLGPDEGLPVEANAELIARAVNAFGPLVEALEGLVELRTAEDCAALDGPLERWFTAQQINDRWAAAFAALSLARGDAGAGVGR